MKMFPWLNCLIAMVLACGCVSTKGTSSPVRPDVSQKELQSCLLELGLDEGATARILADAPLEGELLPADAEWGRERKAQALTTAWTKALAALSEASPERQCVLQVAAALLKQERILYGIYEVSYPLVQNDKGADVEQYRGQILVGLWKQLRRFRQEHPELPGVLAEQVLAELDAWAIFSPEWDVAFSMDALAMTTDSSEADEIPLEKQVYQCFMRCAASIPVVESGKQLWFHWRIAGNLNERVTEVAIYLPALPAGSQCVMNGAFQILSEKGGSLLPVEWKPGEELEVRVEIRLPEDTLNDPAGRAKFPVLLLQKISEDSEEK